MSKKSFYLFLIALVLFNIHMAFYYNYDLGEYQGYNYSHDRDFHTQYGYYNIESGFIEYEELDNKGYPFSENTKVREEVPYPRGFHVLLSTISLVADVNIFLALLFLSFLFVTQILFTTVLISHILYNDKVVASSSIFCASIVPTLGTIHGPLLPLPSTLCTFLILSIILLFSRHINDVSFSFKYVILVLILGLMISLIHRPSTVYALILFISLSAIKNYRVISLFGIIGCLYGLWYNSAIFTESDIYNLTRVPSLSAFVLLIFLVLCLLVYYFIHKYKLSVIFTSKRFERITSLFYLLYSPIVLAAIFFLFIYSFISDYSMVEIVELYRFNLFYGLLIVGGVYFPSIIKSFISRNSFTSLISLFLIVTVSVGLFNPEGLFSESGRLVAYGLAIGSIFQGKFLRDVLFHGESKIMKSVTVMFLCFSFFTCTVEPYEFFDLRAADSGISDISSQSSQFSIEIYEDANSDNVIVIVGDNKIIDKMASRMGTISYDYYVDAWPTQNDLMSKNIPDYVIFRKYQFITKSDVTFNETDIPIDSGNLEPHRYLTAETYYYCKIYENNDIILYSKI